MASATEGLFLPLQRAKGRKTRPTDRFLQFIWRFWRRESLSKKYCRFLSVFVFPLLFTGSAVCVRRVRRVCRFRNAAFFMPKQVNAELSPRFLIEPSWMQRCQWPSVRWGWSLQKLRCCGAFRMRLSRLVRLGFVALAVHWLARLIARSLMSKTSKMSKSVTGRPLPQQVPRERRKTRERRETTTPEQQAVLSKSEQLWAVSLIIFIASHCNILQHCLTLFWWGRTSWYIMIHHDNMQTLKMSDQFHTNVTCAELANLSLW